MATNFLLLNLDKNEVTVFDPKNFINMVVYIPLLHVIKRYLLCGCFIQSPRAFFFPLLFSLNLVLLEVSFCWWVFLSHRHQVFLLGDCLIFGVFSPKLQSFYFRKFIEGTVVVVWCYIKNPKFTSDMYTEIDCALSLENCKIQYLRTIKAHLKRQKSHCETFIGTAWGTFSELFSKAVD